jgi:Leucine rich repeat N-terminal domain
MESFMLNVRRLIGKHLAALSLALFCVGASHAIPASERAVLLAIYSSTNGTGWTGNTNWNGPVGTECTWYGVTCSTGNANVIQLNLTGNNLVGTLPSTLNQLTQLNYLGLSVNRLSGIIPSLAGMNALQTTFLHQNQFDGSLPSLAGLTALRTFRAQYNQLTGSIPALAGSTLLTTFTVDNNQLTGNIPPLAGLSALSYFDASSNQLTGNIPSLANLTVLFLFDVSSNQLTGTLPTLAGLTNLSQFRASSNQLTGAIPGLSGLAALSVFHVGSNQLTGTIPPLIGLTNLSNFSVGANQLSGAAPTPPPATMAAGSSSLCPNLLVPVANAIWDAATGSTPWSIGCTGVAQTLTVTPSAGANGSIAPALPQVTSTGRTLSFTITPNPGYSINMEGTCYGTLVGNVFTTDALNEDCSVVAKFSRVDAPAAAAQPVPILRDWMSLLLSALTAALGAWVSFGTEISHKHRQRT